MREDYAAFASPEGGLVKLVFKGHPQYSVYVHNPASAGHAAVADSHLVRSVLEIIAQQSGYEHTKVEEGKHLEEMRIMGIVKGGRGSHISVYAPNGKAVLEALAAAGYKKPEKH